MLHSLNEQLPEKQVLRDDGKLEVHSVFYTIQGEGPLAGTPAVFVRLTGCNLTCPKCDTDYTSRRGLMTPDEMVRVIKLTTNQIIAKTNPFETNPKLIVLTGGEPFRQDFSQFAKAAVYAGYHVQVETNGTLWFDNFYPTRTSIVCSPKAPKIHESLKRYITALKYVVRAGEIDPSDGLPTSVLENGLRPARPWATFNGEIFVQPMDEGERKETDPTGEWLATTLSKRNMDAAVEVCMCYGYRISIQVHKLIGLD